MEHRNTDGFVIGAFPQSGFGMPHLLSPSQFKKDMPGGPMYLPGAHPSTQHCMARPTSRPHTFELLQQSFQDETLEGDIPHFIFHLR